MSVHRKQAGAVITVRDHKTLRAVYPGYRGRCEMLIRYFVVEEGLTDSQFNRLPYWVRRRIKCVDDSVPWLLRLFALEDPR